MPTKTDKVIYPELSYKIVGVLFKVHNELGNRYQEKYYQRAIEIEFNKQGLKYKKEISVNLNYENENIGRYFLDFLIENKIILEIKAKDRLELEDYRQVSRYLKATDLKLGLLVNFRNKSLSCKRILNPRI